MSFFYLKAQFTFEARQVHRHRGGDERRRMPSTTRQEPGGRDRFRRWPAPADSKLNSAGIVT